MIWLTDLSPVEPAGVGGPAQGWSQNRALVLTDPQLRVLSPNLDSLASPVQQWQPSSPLLPQHSEETRKKEQKTERKKTNSHLKLVYIPGVNFENLEFHLNILL